MLSVIDSVFAAVQLIAYGAAAARRALISYFLFHYHLTGAYWLQRCVAIKPNREDIQLAAAVTGCWLLVHQQRRYAGMLWHEPCHTYNFSAYEAARLAIRLIRYAIQHSWLYAFCRRRQPLLPALLPPAAAAFCPHVATLRSAIICRQRTLQIYEPPPFFTACSEIRLCRNRRRRLPQRRRRHACTSYRLRFHASL